MQITASHNISLLLPHSLIHTRRGLLNYLFSFFAKMLKVNDKIEHRRYENNLKLKMESNEEKRKERKEEKEREREEKEKDRRKLHVYCVL
jgi:hypothetical protein